MCGNPGAPKRSLSGCLADATSQGARASRLFFPLRLNLGVKPEPSRYGTQGIVPLDSLEDGIGAPDAFTRRPLFAQSGRSCESAWNKDPVFGVIGIQSELRG
jgi:hypothetical protein